MVCGDVRVHDIAQNIPVSAVTVAKQTAGLPRIVRYRTSDPGA